MTPVTHPSPAQVRAWMNAPARKEGPPPSMEQIRRELGWHLSPSTGRVLEVPRTA